MDRADLAGTDPVHGISDGKQLALLERQGAYLRRAPSLPTGCAGGVGRRVDCMEVGVDVDDHRARVPEFGRAGAAGAFLGTGAASFARAGAPVGFAVPV